MKKEKKRFSLKKRLLALFMALAMVLGVVYIGNRTQRRVVADEPIPEGELYEDDVLYQRISAIGIDHWGVMGGPNYLHYIVPTKKLVLTLPEENKQELDHAGDYPDFVDDDGKIYTSAPADTDLHKTNISYDFIFKFMKHGSLTEEAKGLSLNEDPENGVYKCVDLVWFKNPTIMADQTGNDDAYTGDLDVTSEDSFGAPEVKASILLDGAAVTPVAVDVDNANKLVELSNEAFGEIEPLVDPDGYDYTVEYYGSFRYDLINKTDNETVMEGKENLDEIRNYLNQQSVDQDKEYQLVKRYSSNAYNKVVGDADSDAFVRNFYLGLSGVQTQVGSEHQNYDEYSTINLNANVSQDIYFQFNSAEKMEVAVDPGEFAGTLDPKSGENEYFYQAVIHGAPADNGMTRTFTFTAKGKDTNNAQETITLNITFTDVNTKVNITKVTVNNSGTDEELSPVGDVYYSSSNKVKITAEAKADDVIIDNGSVIPYLNEGTDDVAGAALYPTGEENKYTGELTLTADTPTTVFVEASAAGVKAKSDAIKVLYDSKDPKFGKATLHGMVSGSDVDQELTDSGTFGNKISVKNNHPFSLSVSPSDDSLSEVKGKRVVRDIGTTDGTEEEVAFAYQGDGTYLLSETVTDSFVGKEAVYTVTAKDQSGRETSKQYIVQFVEDKNSIEHVITFGSDNKEVEPEGGEYGPINSGTFSITYTIVSSEKIRPSYGAFFSYGGTEDDVTADVAATESMSIVDGVEEYTYTYTRTVALDYSQEYENALFRFVNENGIEERDTISIVYVDLTDPTVDALPVNDQWVNEYYLFVKYADPMNVNEDDHTLDDTYSSGVKTVTIKQEVGEEGQKNYNLITNIINIDDSKKSEGTLEGIDVIGSVDFYGTRIDIYATDNAGNDSQHVTGTYYVDKSKPVTKEANIALRWQNNNGGYSVNNLFALRNGKLFGGNGVNIFKNPTLIIEPQDNIGVKYVKATVTRSYLGNKEETGVVYYSQDASGGAPIVCAKTEPTTPGMNFKINADNPRTLCELISTALRDGSDISSAFAAGDFDGDYVLKFEVVDNAGNENDKLVEGKFTLINKGPTNTIEVTSVPKTQEGNVKYYDGNATVKLTVTDAMGRKKDGEKITDSIDSELTSAIDTNGWKGAAPTFTNSGTITKEGRHEMSVQAFGRTGLAAPKASAVAVIDLTDPAVSLTYNDEKIDTTKKYFGVKAGIRLSASDTNLMSVEWTVKTTPSDGSESTTETMNSAGTFSCTKDATYEVSYVVTDKALRKTTGSAVFVVDTTAPTNDITIDKSVTPDPAKISQYYDGYINNATGVTYRYGLYYNTSVRLNFTVKDYNTSEISALDTQTGETLSLSWSGPDAKGVQTATTTISGDGPHRIQLSTTDSAGNTANRVAIGFTIDTQKPVLSTTLNGISYTGLRYLNTTGVVGVSISDSYKDENDIAQSVKRTQPSQAAEVLTSTVSEGAQSFDVEADYEVTYRATDRAGNVSDPVTVSFRVDKTEPALTISGIANRGTATQDVTISYGMREAFYWDMEDAEISIFKKLDGGNSQLLRTDKFNPGNANAVMSQLFTEDGEYSFTFKAADKAGNTAETSYSFILDGNAPLITLSGVSNYDKTEKNVEFTAQINETFYLSNKVEISGKRKDKYGDTYDVDFGTISVNSSNPATVEKKFAEDGIYDIVVKATDRAGNKSEQKVHFTIDTEAPELTGLEAYDGTVINEFNGVPDIEDMIIDLTVCKYKFYLDGVEYDGNGDIAQGSHVFRVDVTDEMGHTLTENNEFSFKFDSVAPTILIDGIEEGENLQEAREITVSLQLNEDTLKSVKLNGKDMPIKDNACTFTVDSKGDYELVVTAEDAAGNVTTQTLNFDYEKSSSWLWLILGIIGAVVIVGGGFFILLAKKRKKDEEK